MKKNLKENKKSVETNLKKVDSVIVKDKNGNCTEVPADKMLLSITNQFGLSKTLRFELKPIGKTLENMAMAEVLIKDEKLSEDYKKAKKILDECHKEFIESFLKATVLPVSKLQEYHDLFIQDKKDRDEKTFEKIGKELREEVTKLFKEEPYKAKYDGLFKKDKIDCMVDWIYEHPEHRNDLKKIQDFKGFTTYFHGFDINRKNMYTSEKKSTAISYRIVNDNLPKTIGNIKRYNLIKEKAPDLDFSPILKEMEKEMKGRTLDELFSLENFNNVITQEGIDNFNSIIGGKALEKGKKIKGLNEYINLYNQTQKNKNNKIPKFTKLFKQILSERKITSFLFDKFESRVDVVDGIELFYKTELKEFDHEGKAKDVFLEIKNLLNNIGKSYDYDKIYLNKEKQLTAISQRIFGDYSVIKSALEFYYENEIDPEFEEKLKNAKSINKSKKISKEKDSWMKDYVTIATVQKALDVYIESLDTKHDLRDVYSESLITKYFTNYFKTRLTSGEEVDYIYNIGQKYKAISGILKTKDEDVLKKESVVDQLKDFLDSMIDLNRFVQPLNLPSEDLESLSCKDEIFYSDFAPLMEQLNKIIRLYNMARNFITKKKSDEKNIKINFENATLMFGFDINKQYDNSAFILRKNGLYYMGIISKTCKKFIFDDMPRIKDESNAYEKMNYKLINNAYMSLPHVFFSKSRAQEFKPSEEIERIHLTKTFKKGDNFNIKDCHKMIDFFKESIKKNHDWNVFNFKFSPTESYNDISEFYREVDIQAYKVWFDEKISDSYINTLVEEGDVYLFKIYGKDFSEHSKGMPNLHTMYFKSLFTEENLKDVVYKLCGNGEIFYRKVLIKKEDTITHPANEEIKNKNPLSENKVAIFNYEMKKDKRFTVEKYFLNIPIELNFKADGHENINNKINNIIRNNEYANKLSMDRGERNLIHIIVRNQKGETLESIRLNIINNADYKRLLKERENERKTARKGWKTIENIRNIKKGYLSQAVNVVVSLVRKHNAVIFMEDLSFGFKNGRKHIETQIYQGFEKALIDKLSYLVFKDKGMDSKEPGGTLNALQLCNKFKTFKEMGKQNGIIFFVPAGYTSKICPATGFVNLLKTKYESNKKAKFFFSNFDYIKYNKDKDYFEFSFDYNNFIKSNDENSLRNTKGAITKWVACTYGDLRYKYNRNTKASDEINVTQNIKSILDKFNIPYKNGKCFKSSLIEKDEKDLFCEILQMLSLTLSLRYSKTGTDIDFILSPVANKNGVFFDSRNATNAMPKDGDENGTYHINLKGDWVFEQINKTEDSKKPNLYLRNNEWFAYAQSKCNEIDNAPNWNYRIKKEVSKKKTSKKNKKEVVVKK
jgi:CRISPR-associated protein Cpf1